MSLKSRHSLASTWANWQSHSPDSGKHSKRTKFHKDEKGSMLSASIELSGQNFTDWILHWADSSTLLHSPVTFFCPQGAKKCCCFSISLWRSPGKQFYSRRWNSAPRWPASAWVSGRRGCWRLTAWPERAALSPTRTDIPSAHAHLENTVRKHPWALCYIVKQPIIPGDTWVLN